MMECALENRKHQQSPNHTLVMGYKRQGPKHQYWKSLTFGQILVLASLRRLLFLPAAQRLGQVEGFVGSSSWEDDFLDKIRCTSSWEDNFLFFLVWDNILSNFRGYFCRENDFLLLVCISSYFYTNLEFLDK